MKTMRCILKKDNLLESTWIFRLTELFLAFITNPIKRTAVLSTASSTIQTFTHIACKQKFILKLRRQWEKEKQRARERGEM